MIYLMDGPFECRHCGDCGHVVAYRKGRFLFVGQSGWASWGNADNFTPPPPIPAAALSPKVGEIWVINGWPHLLIRKLHDNFYCLEPSCGKVARYRVTGIGARPATPEEAEPFRPLFEGLKAHLEEK